MQASNILCKIQIIAGLTTNTQCGIVNRIVIILMGFYYFTLTWCCLLWQDSCCHPWVSPQGTKDTPTPTRFYSGICFIQFALHSADRVGCWLIANQPEQLTAYQPASSRGQIGDSTPYSCHICLYNVNRGQYTSCCRPFLVYFDNLNTGSIDNYVDATSHCHFVLILYLDYLGCLATNSSVATTGKQITDGIFVFVQ